jgi:hypothetical protein
VFIDGEKAMTLRGDNIAQEFHQIVETYIEKRFGEAPSATVATDAFERSSNHPHIFFVDEDSSVLAHNLSAALSPEKPHALRAAPKDPLQIFFAARHHAIAFWRGRSAQGRWVKWLKRYLKL